MYVDPYHKQVYQQYLNETKPHGLNLPLMDYPTSIDYDQVENRIYWIDREQRVFKSSGMDGSSPKILSQIPRGKSCVDIIGNGAHKLVMSSLDAHRCWANSPVIGWSIKALVLCRPWKRRHLPHEYGEWWSPSWVGHGIPAPCSRSGPNEWVSSHSTLKPKIHVQLLKFRMCFRRRVFYTDGGSVKVTDRDGDDVDILVEGLQQPVALSMRPMGEHQQKEVPFTATFPSGVHSEFSDFRARVIHRPEKWNNPEDSDQCQWCIYCGSGAGSRCGALCSCCWQWAHLLHSLEQKVGHHNTWNNLECIKLTIFYLQIAEVSTGLINPQEETWLKLFPLCSPESQISRYSRR